MGSFWGPNEKIKGSGPRPVKNFFKKAPKFFPVKRNKAPRQKKKKMVSKKKVFPFWKKLKIYRPLGEKKKK